MVTGCVVRVPVATTALTAASDLVDGISRVVGVYREKDVGVETAHITDAARADKCICLDVLQQLG